MNNAGFNEDTYTANINKSCTVHAAKCYDQSRLITWNFESHVTFLRGFCVDITRKYREFCVERGDRTWTSATLA